MIRVSHVSTKRSTAWIPIVVSVLLHLGFYSQADGLGQIAPKTYGSSRVEFRSPPPPPPKPEPVEVPKPEPKPEPKPKPKPRPITPPEPVSNRETPPPKEPAKTPPKAVFGVTAESVAEGQTGVSVRVGNTLAKNMEKDYTKPAEVGALPARKKSLVPVPTYELTRMPEFMTKIEPEYPADAKKRGIEGVVQLEVVIDEEGRVRKVRILSAPDRALAASAAKAASKSRFKPGLVGKEAVAVTLRIPYRFVLDT